MENKEHPTDIDLSNSDSLPTPKRKIERGVDSPHRKLQRICFTGFCSTTRYDRLLSEDSNKELCTRKSDPIWPCGEDIISLLKQLCEIIRERKGDHAFAIKRCNDLIQIGYDKFYSFPYKDVPICWVELYRDASLLKFAAIAMTQVWEGKAQDSPDVPRMTESQLDDLVRAMDMALIMTGPPSEAKKAMMLNTAMELLQECHNDLQTSEEQKYTDHGSSQQLAKRQKLGAEEDNSPDGILSLSNGAAHPSDPQINRQNAVPRCPPISFAAFIAWMNRPLDPAIGPMPLIIHGLMEHWPALNERAWKNPEYLMKKTIGGRRLVPIETGKSYVDANFGQKIVTFKEFLDSNILNPSSQAERSYLAQHDLFSQIPSLRQDIAIPDLCYTPAPGPHPDSPFFEEHSKVPKLTDVLQNAWFGPSGTTTPLHTDPYHNFLAQVVGRKYVRLYAPCDSMKLYPRGMEGGINMSNTSRVDIGLLAGLDGSPSEIAAEVEKFPLAKDARYWECILEESQCLYIPIGWWHFVRSLGVSFSVSFWFN